jgi:hypothetical protein
MTGDLSGEILDYLKRIDESVNGPRPQEGAPDVGRPLSDRVSEVRLGLATLAADTETRFEKIDERFNAVDSRFNRIDKRFDQVECRIESTRAEIVDLVTRVHSELTGRIIDLEVPGPGEKGSGGRGSGGSGVPLAP